MARVDHDYSRIMMSLRLLPSVLCNDVQPGILYMAYSVNIFIVYTVSLVGLVYTHSTWQRLQAEHGEQFFDFSSI